MAKRSNSSVRIASGIVVHDDYWFLGAAVRAVVPAGPCHVFVSRLPWGDMPGDWERCARIAAEAGAEVVVGDWASEQEHRAAALAHLKGAGYTHALIPDGDEIMEPDLREALVKIANTDLADAVHVSMATYWKSAHYAITPPEALTPVALIKLGAVGFLFIREFEARRRLTLGPAHGVLHHLSYAGPGERVLRKLSTFSHKDEIVEDWYQRVYRGWDEDKLMRNLHPTHPAAYHMAEHIRVPDILACCACDGGAGVSPAHPVGIAAGKLPKSVSAVIPLYGNPADIRQCLESLSLCLDLVQEVIVVDNASPDDAAEVAASFPFVTFMRNEKNEGFAKASNQGYAASNGEVVLFLNSDTVVPRAGLQRLLECLWTSGSVAAAGPYTNNAGHLQKIDPTYTSLGTLDLFAEDFAERDAQDVETDMLVGFCLACRRSVLDELGAFDESFGLGTFEDNDLCYRMRRGGYRLLIAARSFVHHHGSRSLGTLPNRSEVFAGNQRIFLAKWQGDLASGFASGLSGLQAERISFNAERHPDKIAREIEALAKRADVSLCMIMRNEERVIADCLKSAKPFFSQIVLVDTGSTDRSVEIAESLGVHVHHHPWQDSFSEARNHSLDYAEGKWIFWMDADDTLPAYTGECLLRAALDAPPEIVGFVMQVQFLDEGPGAGTRVDHVKLFRNVPGLRFEGRIHEQILSELRKHGEIARLEAVVLHSGYDTSVEGQKKKRVRDFKLLELDLKERPNHPFVLFNLGMTYHYTGEHKKAIEWLEKSIAHAAKGESHLRKAYALLAVSQRELGRREEALRTLEKGLEDVGEDPELRFQSALILTALGRLEEAREQYMRAPGNTSDHFSSVDVGILGFKRYHNLAAVCMALGRYPEGKQWWLKAIEESPAFLPSAFELFDAALANQDFPCAAVCLERVLAGEGPGHNWLQMGQKHAEAVGGPENVEPFLRQACRRFPWSPAVRLALARRLLEENRVPDALPILMELQNRGVAEAAFYLGVTHIRAGRYPQALFWMERALELNPGHPDTQAQVENLRRAVAAG
jgi:GT2 family glycosyltransferase/Tfp pilus assembly protein PilF